MFQARHHSPEAPLSATSAQAPPSLPSGISLPSTSRFNGGNATPSGDDGKLFALNSLPKNREFQKIVTLGMVHQLLPPPSHMVADNRLLQNLESMHHTSPRHRRRQAMSIRRLPSPSTGSIVVRRIVMRIIVFIYCVMIFFE
ncbi:hypothetical protein B9Z55_026551 [Caenorhabditis nigoni]|uniref:Uncharacterized protein n=1 Tax=Caenorhabditis nigoni TaxID=1611254 RepID=A0A2G5T3W9_9PELO|nr:hypothetical protein B9Z55_026551 [Caenorhabditis nigoni]